ncbi:MAG: hypothetical protein H8E34_00210 [Bacteroidetes bacterium]|nr:hypothetical protein [Bacteroidota bacterium]
MKINNSYSIDQIESVGLKEKEIKDLQASIYIKDNKVYFFEPVGEEKLRLYSIINERSFFL